MPYKIIVADPSPSIQKAAQLVFSEPEFRVFIFEDGASLLESIAGIITQKGTRRDGAGKRPQIHSPS